MAVQPSTLVRVPVSAREDWLELARELDLRGLPSRLVSRRGRQEVEIAVDADRTAAPDRALGEVMSILESWLARCGEDSVAAQVGYRVRLLRANG